VPELPETETIARDLHARVAGSTIAGTKVPRPDVLREVTPRELSARARGKRIVRSWRRAKLVVLDLSDGHRRVVQPRFTGALLVDDGKLAPESLDYITIRFSLDDGRALLYRDVRRLGTVALMSATRFAEYTDALGPEPLDPGFSGQHLWDILRSSSQPVKKVLMDQRRLAGVGNIYANDALWRAGIDPSRESRSVAVDEATVLHRELVDILRRAIEARGTSFRDYRDASGKAGGFVSQLAAYGRGGEPCLRCGRRLVETHAIDGRSTVFCATCQR
jgi:formamidopyrimidine-DNA glycosylase